MTAQTYRFELTETEARMVALWRRKISRYSCLPPGWEFTVSSNPDRMIADFRDKDNLVLSAVDQLWQRELGLR